MTGNDNTVEALIRYASMRFTAAGIEYRPSKMSKVIRRASRLTLAREIIDNYLSDRIEDASWRGFELFVNGHADPTAANAARNLEPGVSWRDDEKQWAVDAR